MKTYLDCIPCLLRQAVDVLDCGNLSVPEREESIRAVLAALAQEDFASSPPALAGQIHRVLRPRTGVRDPYRAIKGRMNWFALNLMPGLQRKVSSSANPLATAVRLAIAGNVIDLGVAGHMKTGTTMEALHGALEAPLLGMPRALAEAAADAEQILFLADNAGEIVFDQLLLEQLPGKNILVAVRGHPILNDATLADACATGLTKRWTVIENGSDVPGTDLPSCSESFRQLYDEADLVIAKGQGNYETLSNTPKHTFFLLKAKCPVIARDLDCEVGAMVLRESGETGAVAQTVKQDDVRE